MPTSTPSPENLQRPANISPNLDKRLLNYATAASAAGVGLLALAHPAEAKVIYTPTNLPITVNGPFVQLDVNNDGVADFSFYNGIQSGDARRGKHPAGKPPLGFYAHVIAVLPAQSSNQVGAITSFGKGVCAAELPKGRLISANKNFQPGELDLFAVAGDYTSPGSVACPWQGRGNLGGFLALKFVAGGNTYFGWARIALNTTVPTITGYAYEDTPGASIKSGAMGGPEEKSDASQTPALPAPQPATLGALARGASGLALWRRPEEMD
jgi:hypothetical protein